MPNTATKPKLDQETARAREQYLRDWQGWVQVALDVAGPTARKAVRTPNRSAE